MKDFISALLAILGTLLVLAGATVTVVRSMGTAPADTTATATGNKAMGWLRRLNGADRLVAWGIVLLVLAAISAGAISFSLGASGGTH